MEHAAEALKMAFAVLAFVIALSVAFMMVNLAKSTADDVFLAKDKQDYVEGITSIAADRNANYRIVGLDTIIPTIYRYAQENYGVIIIEGNDIVALYDLQVESNVSNWSTKWNPGQTYYTDFENMVNGYDITDVNGNVDHVEGIKEYIVNSTGVNVSAFDFRNLFKEIYKIIDTNSTYCPWTSSTYNIMKRVKADMNGDNLIYFNEIENKIKYKGRHWSGEGFIDHYGNHAFKEYYYQVLERSAQTQEEEVTRLQIIYVME